MVDVRLGTWGELGREARAIRTAVFVQEQQIPAELEWDAADAGRVHAVAYNRLGMRAGHRPAARSTRRAWPRSAAWRCCRRCAARHRPRLLDALMDAARQRGDREVMLHAQMSAAGFYARAGFTMRGSPFEEAGIPHVEMVRAL